MYVCIQLYYDPFVLSVYPDSSVGFSTTQQQQQRLNYQITTSKCPIQIKVAESIGIVNIPLFRDGYLNHSVGVVCYIIDKTSKNDCPDSSNISFAYFHEGETNANCSFTIVNDNRNENLEYFEVKMNITKGFAHVNYANYPVCVFIKHDEKDG